MKPFLFIILIFFTQVLSAQENVSMVLDRYFQAIGGQENISQLKSIYSFADCAGPNGKYQTEIYSAKESKTIFRQIRENKPDYIGMVNGDYFWTKDTQVTSSDKKTGFVWRMHELQWIATHLTDRFSEIKFSGNEVFAGKQAIKLSATDELNQSAYIFFDKTNYLLLGVTLINPFQENREMIQMEIVDWKKEKNLQFPSKVSFTDKQGNFVCNFKTITVNQIDETVFDVPKKIMATKRILELDYMQKTAHFNRDAKILVSLLADNFIELRNGKISIPKREDLINRFQEYFDSVTFIEWDDIQSPIIKVSDDGTMAYTLVNKKVRVRTKEGKEESATYAWTSTFQEINDGWLITSITSTTEN